VTGHLSEVVPKLAYRVFDSAFPRVYHLGDFLLAPACPLNKVVIWLDLLYLMLGSETDRGVAID